MSTERGIFQERLRQARGAIRRITASGGLHDAQWFDALAEAVEYERKSLDDVEQLRKLEQGGAERSGGAQEDESAVPESEKPSTDDALWRVLGVAVGAGVFAFAVAFEIAKRGEDLSRVYPDLDR